MSKKSELSKLVVRHNPCVNEKISSNTVSLVRGDGSSILVVSRQEALEMAYETGLDLVEVSPNEIPPVCRLMNYGKYRFKLQRRRQAECRSKRGNNIKEVKLRLTIEESDYQTKLRSVKGFLEKKMKVRISLNLRGREVLHTEVGMNRLTRLISDIGSIGKADSDPKLDGRLISLIVKPV